MNSIHGFSVEYFQAKAESENGPGGAGQAHRAETTPKVGGGDRERVRQPESGRGGSAQQGSAKKRFDRLENQQPEDVGEPQEGGLVFPGQVSLRPSGEDVGSVRQSGEVGNEHDGRPADRGERQSDAAAGGRSSHGGSAGPVDAATTKGDLGNFAQRNNEKISPEATAETLMPTERNTQKELELLEAVANVPPEARRRIQKDTVLEIVAVIALLIILKLVFG